MSLRSPSFKEDLKTRSGGQTERNKEERKRKKQRKKRKKGRKKKRQRERRKERKMFKSQQRETESSVFG